MKSTIIKNLGGLILCCCGLIAGCNMSPTKAITSGPTGTTLTGGTTPPTVVTPTKISQPSIFVSQYSREPYSVLVFDGTASGLSTPYLEIPGVIPATDAAGNLYVLSCYSPCSPDINVYRTDNVNPGAPVRSLHTHSTSVYDMTVSRSGEMYVSDSKGVTVFGAGASGDDAPSRYVQVSNASSIAVDHSGNLFVRNSGGTVSVFDATATGAAVPIRVISGPNTQMRSAYALDYGGIAVDAEGNLYVLCMAENPDGLNSFRVFEFGRDANGNVAPLRFVTTPGMDPAYDGTGVAVDAAGTIYVSASLGLNEGAVFEFPANASGSVTPSKVISSSAWGENAGGIALY